MMARSHCFTGLRGRDDSEARGGLRAGRGGDRCRSSRREADEAEEEEEEGAPAGRLESLTLDGKVSPDRRAASVECDVETEEEEGVVAEADCAEAGFVALFDASGCCGSRAARPASLGAEGVVDDGDVKDEVLPDAERATFSLEADLAGVELGAATGGFSALAFGVSALTRNSLALDSREEDAAGAVSRGGLRSFDDADAGADLLEALGAARGASPTFFSRLSRSCELLSRSSTSA